MPDDIHEKLVAVGVVESRADSRPTLGTLLERYFASLSVKPSTVMAYSQTRHSLEGHFGTARLLRTIGALQAEDWVKSLRNQGLAPATQSKRIRIAKTIFGRALRWKMIEENPFLDVKSGSQMNRSRAFYIPLDVFAQVLAACPDSEWKLILALARFGGLRCPSEMLALTWADVDFAEGRIRVHSLKTAHHEGHDQRFVPMFPELREHLMTAFDRAEEGARHVIARYRSTNVNLRTQFKRILARAGVKPWPRLFQNLRASRQTELAAEYPLADVCQWLGNSPAIASKHYLQATDANFERASRVATHDTKRGTESGTPAARNAAQHAEVGDRTDLQKTQFGPENAEKPRSSAIAYDGLQNWGMGATGLEPVTSAM